jgi:hypothetical protein
MSKRKLNLAFKDMRDYFGNLNQSHPIHFFLSFDHEVYKFKNVTSANKFLRSFEINYNYYYFQIFDVLPFLYEINIQSIHLKTELNLNRFRLDLDFYINRTENFLKYSRIVDTPAREILNFYHTIDEQLIYFHKLYQKSNRNQYLLKSIKNNLLNINRLKNELDLFLENKTHLTKVPKEVLKTKKYRLLKIA